MPDEIIGEMTANNVYEPPNINAICTKFFHLIYYAISFVCERNELSKFLTVGCAVKMHDEKAGVRLKL